MQTLDDISLQRQANLVAIKSHPWTVAGVIVAVLGIFLTVFLDLRREDALSPPGAIQSPETKKEGGSGSQGQPDKSKSQGDPGLADRKESGSNSPDKSKEGQGSSSEGSGSSSRQPPPPPIRRPATVAEIESRIYPFRCPKC